MCVTQLAASLAKKCTNTVIPVLVQLPFPIWILAYLRLKTIVIATICNTFFHKGTHDMATSFEFHKRFAGFLPALVLIGATQVNAASADDAKGLWITAQKDAVIEFKICPDRPGALCGQIVWDKDSGTPADTCGVRIAQLDKYNSDKEAWRDGWIYDPRDKKNYKGVIRVKGKTLNMRAYIGVEVLGETEELFHVDSMPATPACKAR
jgi:uncharacterized protein (DUF2147 family)